jgi:hypothetical protein
MKEQDKRDVTKRQAEESGRWQIIEESKDHLNCSPT